MASIAGSQGWELVSIYDMASNWIGGFEKRFMLLKRPVPPGLQLEETEWCNRHQRPQGIGGG